MGYDNFVVSLSPTLNSRKDGPYCMTFAYFMRDGDLTIFQVSPGEGGPFSNPLWHEDLGEDSWRRGFITLKHMDTFQVSHRILGNTPVG